MTTGLQALENGYGPTARQDQITRSPARRILQPWTAAFKRVSRAPFEPRRLGRMVSVLAIGLLVPLLAHANVGRTPATFHVNRDGAATYDIPIWVPPGPKGLEPHVALTYDSQSGSGDMGIGWSLAGISSISRCNRTTAQNGTPAPVALTTSDAFCLDGAQLELTGGSYGAAGSTYQTEIANFEQVTAYGSAGNGPAYFIVQGPHGTQYEYGNGGGAQVLASGTSTAMQWYLDKVTDPSGNTMTFAYTDGTGSAVPSTISWTPTSSGASTYAYTMQFTYGTNSAASSTYGYVAGTSVSNTNLLQAITVDYQGTTVRKYALTYQQSPTTTREELTQVQECADAAQTNCLAPTTFSYQSPSSGVETNATSALGNAPGSLAWNYHFAGNSSDDLAYCTAAPSLTVEVAFASSSGYGTPVDTGIPCETNGTVTALYGDLLGNGQDGILAVNGGVWYYYQWNGSSFVGQSTGVAYQEAYQYVLADVTGDGRPALVEMNYSSSNEELTIDVRLNTSSGSTISFSSTNAQWLALSTGATQSFWANIQSTSDGQAGSLGNVGLRHLDFNGDSRDDLALEYQTSTCIMFRNVCRESYHDYADELISTGSNFDVTQIATASTMTMSAPEFLNFNSDACTDYLYNSVIYVSGCNGTPATTVTVPSSDIIGVMDWNEDGRTDILVDNGGYIGVYESTGTGLSSLISTSIPYTAGDGYFAFDPTGSGLDALGVWDEESSPASVEFYPHNGNADLLTTLTDGYGNTIKPTYITLAEGSGSTYTPASDAQFPYENYTGTLNVVSQVAYSDPSNPPNGTYQRTHYYSGAWMNRQGLGFMGFETDAVYDSRNQLYTQRTFNPTFPYTGMLLAEKVTENSASGQVVSSVANTLSDTTLSSTQGSERYFPYVSASTQKQYAVGGSENSSLTSNTTTSYSYDNYGNATSVSTTITDEDGGSPDYGQSWTTAVTNTPDANTSTWCLRLLTQRAVRYSDSLYDSPAVTENTSYTPNTNSCRYSQIVQQSGSAYQVTESLGYDSFGNVDSDTVTGNGMAGRTSSVSWGTTGQFPMSITNPLGETTTFNYDFGCGLVSSMTDPNGETTNWQYGEGFCRVTQETRPDGTYTTWGYTLYAGADPKPRMLVTEEAHDTSGNMIRTTTEEFDMENRPYLEQTDLLNGAMATVMQQDYDSLGRVVSQEIPYDGSTVGAVTYSYDLLNRVTGMQRPTSASDSTAAIWTYQYNGLNEVITNPDGESRTLDWDPNGWLRESMDDLGYAVTFGYDAAGDENEVTDNEGNTLWTGAYADGIRPFLIGETSMDRGAWGFTVDALGERTAWTDAKGQQFFESYDALSRPVTLSEPDVFTQWTWGSSASAHNVGRLAGVCTGTGTNPTGCSSSGESEARTYDSDGRLSTRTITLPNSGSYTYTWQYSPTTGLLSSLTYPGTANVAALTLQYGYAYGYLQSITDTLDSPNIVVWTANQMNPDEQITQDTLGNGIVTTRTYDAVTHLLTAVQSGVGGGAAVQNQGFLYDPDGNLVERQDNDLGMTENFYYDGDNRLSYSTLNGTRNLTMTYNPMGDITSRSDVLGGGTWTYDPNRKHEVTAISSPATPPVTWTYGYDANGNMTSGPGRTITWTSYNYPSEIDDTATGESVSFNYGPSRNPWLETTQEPSGTTETYRLGKLMDIVVSGSSTAYRDYIYAGNEPVAVDEPGTGASGFHYFQTDQQGSIAEITNGSGQVSVNESFTAFGALRNPTTWSGSSTSAELATITGITQHAYTFQRMLGEQMGLNDMIGRVEDAVIGRFMSADPYVTDPENPQDWNPYSYVYNNPMSYTDPTGFHTNCHEGSGSDPTCSGGGGGGGASNPPTAGQPNWLNHLPPIPINGTYCSSCALLTLFSVGDATPFPSGHVGGGVPESTATSQSPPPQSNPPPAKLQPVTMTATRLPDFVHFSFSFPIENEFTGLYLGIGFTLTFDRYGNVYVSVNGVAGVPTAKGRSAMVGWMNSSSTPSDSQLSGMLSSWGGGAQVGVGRGFGFGFYGNSSGTSESGGYSSSGASVYGGYTWEMPSISPVHW